MIKPYQVRVYAVEGTPITKLIAELVAAVGGATTTKGQGWWRMSHGALVCEEVTIVEVFCNFDETFLVTSAIVAYVDACIKGGQEGVAVYSAGPDCHSELSIYSDDFPCRLGGAAA